MTEIGGTYVQVVRAARKFGFPITPAFISWNDYHHVQLKSMVITKKAFGHHPASLHWFPIYRLR